MNVSMDSSIDEEVEGEKVERETLDTTVYPPDYVTEVKYQCYCLPVTEVK